MARFRKNDFFKWAQFFRIIHKKREKNIGTFKY